MESKFKKAEELELEIMSFFDKLYSPYFELSYESI